MKQKIYDISICILALISVTFAIMDITSGLSNILKIIDNIIYAIFILDYVIRFIIAESKKELFKEHI